MLTLKTDQTSFHYADSGITTQLDTALAHPWSKDTIEGAAKECGSAVVKREARKTTKYSKETLPDGSKSTMILI